MSGLQKWACASREAEAIYRETCTFLDEAVVDAVGRLPQLETRKRGKETIHRFPKKNLDVILTLILVQLRGSIKAGELLIESGLFLEWEIIQRTMQDMMEDVTFLVDGEGRETKVYRRYKASFFDEDLDKDGELTKQKTVVVARSEIRKALADMQKRQGGPGTAICEQSRRLHRVRSGSVHGRASSIVRAYFDESTETKLWLEGAREQRRTAWERPGLYMMAAWVVSTFSVAGAGRWDDDCVRRAIELSGRLRDASIRLIEIADSIGWDGWGQGKTDDSQ